MSDAFDVAMADIATASAVNGGPSLTNILMAMRAAHDVAIAAAEKNAAGIRENAQTLAQISSYLDSEVGTIQRAIDASMEKHMVWTAEVPTARVLAIEEPLALCPACHAATRRGDDPKDADYSERRYGGFAFKDGYEKTAYDKGVRRHFLTTTTRYIVVTIVVIMLASLAFALLDHRDDIQGDIATGLSSTIAAAMLIYALMRRDKGK